MGITSNDNNPSIEGGTDGTLIGNVGDAMKVSSALNPVPLVNIITKSVELISSGSATNMNVNGTVTPVNFDFTPASGETWYVRSATFFLFDSGVTAVINFGALTALVNGLSFSVKSNGTESEYAVIKNNMDVLTIFPENPLIPPTSGFMETSDAYRGHVTFPGPLLLKNSTSDFIRMRVRDNLMLIDQLRVRVTLWRTA